MKHNSAENVKSIFSEILPHDLMVNIQSYVHTYNWHVMVGIWCL